MGGGGVRAEVGPRWAGATERRRREPLSWGPHPVLWLPAWSVVEVLWGVEGRREEGQAEPAQLAWAGPAAGWKWLLGSAVSSSE